MKITQIPTTCLFDENISYSAKGIYCLLYSRTKANNPINRDLKYSARAFTKGIKELIKNNYIKIYQNNVVFLK